MRIVVTFRTDAMNHAFSSHPSMGRQWSDIRKKVEQVEPENPNKAWLVYLRSHDSESRDNDEYYDKLSENTLRERPISAAPD